MSIVLETLAAEPRLAASFAIELGATAAAPTAAAPTAAAALPPPAAGGASLPPLPPAAAPSLHILCHASSQAAGVPVSSLGEGAGLAAAGYFAGQPLPGRGGAIHLLTDRLPSPAALASVLRHELVHAVDHAVHGLDMGSCAGLACSEVRAAWLQECQGVWPAWRRQRCAGQHAGVSADMAFPGAGRLCVQAMLGECSRGDVWHSPVQAVHRALQAEREARGLG